MIIKVKCSAQGDFFGGHWGGRGGLGAKAWHLLPALWKTTVLGKCRLLNPMTRHPWGWAGSQVTK